MLVWWILLVFLLEVSAIRTAIIQQRIPCSTHKHVWEICTLKLLKVGEWKWTGEVRREKSSKEPQMQPWSLEVTAGLTRERGIVRFRLGLTSARRSRDFVSIPVGVGSITCSKALWPEAWRCGHLSGNEHSWQRNKLPCFHPLCQAAEHNIYKPYNWYCRNTFSLSTGHTLQLSQNHVKIQRRCQEDPLVALAKRAKHQKRWLGSLSLPHPCTSLLPCQWCQQRDNMQQRDNTGISPVWSPIGVPLWGLSPKTQATESQWRCPPFQGAQANFHHPAEIWKNQRSRET